MVSFCVDGHGHPGFIIQRSYIAVDSVRVVNGLFCDPNRKEPTSAVTISSWTSFLDGEERSFSSQKPPDWICEHQTCYTVTTGGGGSPHPASRLKMSGVIPSLPPAQRSSYCRSVSSGEVTVGTRWMHDRSEVTTDMGTAQLSAVQNLLKCRTNLSYINSNPVWQ
jgi:hypothetical protein